MKWDEPGGEGWSVERAYRPVSPSSRQIAVIGQANPFSHKGQIG